MLTGFFCAIICFAASCAEKKVPSSWFEDQHKFDSEFANILHSQALSAESHPRYARQMALKAQYQRL
jgi:hypothetical protein